MEEEIFTMKRHVGRPKQEAKPVIRTSVTISPEFYRKSIEHNIGFSEALRVGIAIILAEKGVADYDNRLTIVRRMERAVEQLSATSLELSELKDKLAMK